MDEICFPDFALSKPLYPQHVFFLCRLFVLSDEVSVLTVLVDHVFYYTQLLSVICLFITFIRFDPCLEKEG